MTTINGSTTFAQSGVGLDMEGQLALLILENQDAQHDAAGADKQLARDRFIAASDREVAAMREEADDILLGAVAQAAVSITAATIQLADAADAPDVDACGREIQESPCAPIAAATSNALSQPLGKVLGDSPAASDRADARRAGSDAQQARWQLDDANDAIGRAQARQDKAMDWLAAETANQASTETGIIAGFA